MGDGNWYTRPVQQKIATEPSDVMREIVEFGFLQDDCSSVFLMIL